MNALRNQDLYIFFLYNYRIKQNEKNAAQFFCESCQGAYVENFRKKY